MTPDALRAAIASARLRPRMYTPTPGTLAIALYWLVSGAAAEDIGALWGDAYSPADPLAPTDAEVCDAAEATVSALWPQGDAPAGDECAAYSAAPLDTPMPPAFVAALARLSPAQPGALDLDAIEARANAASAGPWVLRLGPHAIPEVHGPKYGVAFTFYGEGEGENDHADADAAFIAAARTDVPALLARVREMEAQLAAAQPVLMLDAIRRGPPLTWVRCLACGGTRADVDGAPCEPCRGTGRQPPPLADRDLCPHCGALDLDHACPKSAATVAGEAFAAEHPEAAGRILG